MMFHNFIDILSTNLPPFHLSQRHILVYLFIYLFRLYNKIPEAGWLTEMRFISFPSWRLGSLSWCLAGYPECLMADRMTLNSP